MKRDKLKIMQQVYSPQASLLMRSSLAMLQKGKWWGHELNTPTSAQTLTS